MSSPVSAASETGYKEVCDLLERYDLQTVLVNIGKAVQFSAVQWYPRMSDIPEMEADVMNLAAKYDESGSVMNVTIDKDSEEILDCFEDDMYFSVHDGGKE